MVWRGVLHNLPLSFRKLKIINCGFNDDFEIQRLKTSSVSKGRSKLNQEKIVGLLKIEKKKFISKLNLTKVFLWSDLEVKLGPYRHTPLLCL